MKITIECDPKEIADLVAATTKSAETLVDEKLAERDRKNAETREHVIGYIKKQTEEIKSRR